MNKISYENIGVFVDNIVTCMSDKIINIVAKYPEASEIVRLLAMTGKCPLQFIHLEPSDFDGYQDEYYIDVDMEYGISCAEAKIDDRYLTLQSDAVFVFDDCNSAILKHIVSDSVYEISIGEEGIALPWVE